MSDQEQIFDALSSIEASLDRHEKRIDEALVVANRIDWELETYVSSKLAKRATFVQCTKQLTFT